MKNKKELSEKELEKVTGGEAIPDSVGGLVGTQTGSTVKGYNDGEIEGEQKEAVKGKAYVGGLVGLNSEVNR